MSESARSVEIDEAKMHEFMGKVVTDFGASLSTVLGFIGQKLGLYEALADSEGMTPAALAEKTGTKERYVREWLINQAAGGYVHYDSALGTYSMLPEQRVALTDEDSPFYVGGGFFVVKAMINAQPRIADAFVNGGGLLWGDNDPDLFVGTEKFFRPGYKSHLIDSWIPAVSNANEKLAAGARVADVGCGHGASTIIMAKAYPNSHFFGFDNHEGSIATAKKKAVDEGVSDRVSFEVANARNFPGVDYDLVCFFDCLHDMGDPHAAAKRAFETLRSDGSCLIVEPMAGNTTEENFNIVGRVFSAASTLCCTPNSLALGGPGLGAVASEDALRDVVLSGGFSEFRRVAETPFNRVFEAVH